MTAQAKKHEVSVDSVIAPGQTIGILGGGQLGRMTAARALDMGYRVVAFSPHGEDPIAPCAHEHIVADYDDEGALARFAARADVVTSEFENVPYATLARVAEKTRVHPNPDAFRIAQNRILEKALFQEQALPVAPNVGLPQGCDAASELAGSRFPGILKTATSGYDGKGQVRVASRDQALEALAAPEATGRDWIYEELVPFQCEISVVLARGWDGSTRAFAPSRNHHVGGILRESLYPCGLGRDSIAMAKEWTAKVAAALNLCGLLAIEYFVLDDGTLVANEMAPRPHNSGHWTQDGAATCQFEQLVRAICGLPLGPTDGRPTRMINLIGDEVDGWRDYIALAGAKVHLYGKGDTRPGRKMGHVNLI